MNWSDIQSNWAVCASRLESRFPKLDRHELWKLRRSRSSFEAYLAQSHDLTLGEAREEVEDFLFIEGLARELEFERV